MKIKNLLYLFMNQMNIPQYAPIVLFVYNRPWHTKQTLNSLIKNELACKSILYIYADGAKPNATPTQIEAIKEVRTIIREKQWCKEVHIIENEQNKGLANSIITGVTQVIDRYGKIIVLEDDMLTSPHFLTFMNKSLDFYEKQGEVANIHAYIYDIPGLPSTFFLNDPGCWGWATWKRSWKLFEPDGAKLIKEIEAKKLIKRFDYEGTYPYFLMLKNQVEGKNDSWAIRWYASLFLKNKLSLYPSKSLIHNIGNDASGTNTVTNERYFDVDISQQIFDIQEINIEPSKEAFQKIANFWRENHPAISSLQKIKSGLKTILFKSNVLKSVIGKLQKEKYLKAEDTYWKGNYPSWNEALSHSDGYDDTISFNRIKEAALKVKNGEAVFERDGKLFYQPEYNWLLMKYLQKIIATNKELSILDFGGALGSTYFQHLWLFKNMPNFSWNVVEQAHFVEFGKKELTAMHLRFFETVEGCKQKTATNVVLLSSVLSYLSEPYKLIEQVKNLDCQYIIIDRTAVADLGTDILTVQHVSPQNLYQGSYPCWIFSEQKLKNAFLEKYKIIDEQFSFDSIPTKVKGLPDRFSNFKCWFLEKK